MQELISQGRFVPEGDVYRMEENLETMLWKVLTCEGVRTIRSGDQIVLLSYHRTLSIVANRVDTLRSQMLRVQRRMAANIIDGVAIGLPLQQVLWRLDSEEEDLRRLSKVLGEVSEEYEVAEQKVKAFAGGA